MCDEKYKKYKLIYFFGPDGTGKTTHADLIASYLRKKGFKVWRTSVKHHHTIAYLLLKLISSLINGYDKHIIDYHGFPRILANKINKIWKIIEFFGLLPAIFYRVLLPTSLSYTVVCDRYVLDTLVALSYFLRDQSLIVSAFARILMKFIPKNSLLIFFDADTNTIMLRKINEPLNFKLIEYYRQMYSILLNTYKIKAERIDTTNTPIQHVHKRIVSLMKSTASV